MAKRGAVAAVSRLMQRADQPGASMEASFRDIQVVRQALCCRVGQLPYIMVRVRALRQASEATRWRAPFMSREVLRQDSQNAEFSGFHSPGEG